MKEITLFYATNNKSKLHNMYYRLRNYPIKVVCPSDLNIHLEINENGDSTVANALIKATAYHKVVNMPVIAADSGVYIKGLSEEDQPGLYVRRFNGKVLSDDEMINHYIDLAKKTEKTCYKYCYTGIALITEDGVITKEISDAPLKLTPYPNTNRKHNGNPLDIITQVEDGRYYNELSDEERAALDEKSEKEFTDFIVQNLLNK